MAHPSVSGSRPSLRQIILPREHGGWAFALEPVLLGMIAAPSVAGAGLALAATTLFLSRRPQQIVAKRDARFIPALFILSILSGLAILGAGWAYAQAGVRCGIPLLAAIPAGLLFIWFDQRKAAREGAAELAGAAFFAAFPAAIALAAGRNGMLAGTLTGFALVRAVSSILSIRSFLRRRKRQSTNPAWSAVAVLTICAGFALFAWRHGAWIPLLWTLGFALVAVWLLSSHAPAWTAKRLGVAQIIIGATAMITTGLSLR